MRIVPSFSAARLRFEGASLAEEPAGCNRRGMDRERTTFRERTPWAGWARAILWGAIVLSCYPILAGWGSGMPFARRVTVVVAVVAVAVAIEVLLGGLTVLVQETRVLIHLGSVPLVRRSVPFSDIVSMESVRYQPIREFGGWGVRGWGRRKAWSARGNEAVALRLEGDRLLLIGSDHPRRLEERIRAAAGRSS